MLHCLSIWRKIGRHLVVACNRPPPKAFIQLKGQETATEQEIKKFCKNMMAPYKVPVSVEFIEEIPRYASGKALRGMLRDKEWEK